MKKSLSHRRVKLLLEREIVALLSPAKLTKAHGGVVTLYSELVQCDPTSSFNLSECC